MKLTFTFDLLLNETQENIIKEIKWHVNKVYNILNYSIREGERKINFKGRTNEEEYTSGVSSIDKEEITRENYNKSRRIKRGLFKTNRGRIINADINGALNILRKYIKEIFSPNLEIAMDIGREQRPIKKRVA